VNANPCPWPDCTCPHVGCLAGWVDNTDSTAAVPCPGCRPEVAEHLRRGRYFMSNARASLRRLERPSKEHAAATRPRRRK
jgi:hypothetical protein